MMTDHTHPITAIIVGAGHRALLYASYAKLHPDELQIVGIAEPNALRREQTAADYDIPAEHCFTSADELAAQPRFADAIINGTMDHQHVATSIPLLEIGYDMLLEKPFATTETGMWQIHQTAKRHGNKVMICHVLRYAPFYAAIRQKVMDGVIGEIISVQTVEHVSYHHMAVAFIRGKWARKIEGYASMLMAKCCHDLDLIAWMKSGIRPVRVSSFGSNMQFAPENAPEGAGTRCLVDCPIEADCLYSARKHYLDHPDRWTFYVWADLENMDSPTLADKEHALRTTSPYGVCAWKTGMDVVDHQTVNIAFEDGSTAIHNMVGGSAKAGRSIHIVGTRGEIQGEFEQNRFVIRRIDPRPGCEYAEEVIDLKAPDTGESGGHGGGDFRLVADFVRAMRGEAPSLSTTSLEDSINGHYIGFAADQAMEENTVITLDFERKEE